MTGKEKSTEILRQLGGNRFLAMTGSYNFIYDDNSLIMKLRRNKAKAQYLKITLNALDTYDLSFSKICKNELNIVKEIKGIYNDMLQKIFTEVTGLYINL